MSAIIHLRSQSQVIAMKEDHEVCVWLSIQVLFLNTDEILMHNPQYYHHKTKCLMNLSKLKWSLLLIVISDSDSVEASTSIVASNSRLNSLMKAREVKVFHYPKAGRLTEVKTYAQLTNKHFHLNEQIQELF
jgi:hypothetical protein